MGRLLQIRVMAQTFRPADVEAAWPRLCRLAWPEAYPERGAPGGPPPAERGVLELVQALSDQASFGGMSKDLSKALTPAIMGVFALKERVEDALADWKPAEANRASDDLEKALDELEREVPKD